MLIKIMPLYSECGVTKACVTAYPVNDIKTSVEQYRYTGKLNKFKSLSDDNLETNVINLYKFYTKRYVILSLMDHNVIEAGKDPLIDNIYELADIIAKTSDRDITRIIKKYNMENVLRGGK